MKNEKGAYILPRPDEGIHIEKKKYIISADLGQANDYTAISIIEQRFSGVGVLGYRRRGEEMLYLRHIERPPRGTEYPAIVDRLIELFKSRQLEDAPKAVVIDYTGLGRLFYDMMRKAGFRRSLSAISITGGMDSTFTEGHYNVPKRELVTALQIRFQNETLKIAKGIKEAAALVEEMANFETKISDSGRDTYGGRSGVHDDIVLSVAMGVWLADQRHFRAAYNEAM